MKIASLSKKIGFVFISTWFVSGCDDAYLTQASKLSNNAQELQSVFEYQATDYIESCYRRANHSLISTKLGPEAFASRIKAREDCDDDDVRKARDNFVLQNQIISNYLVAIVNLAKDENFTLFGDDEKAKLENVVNSALVSSTDNSDSTESSSNLLANINPGKVFSTLVNFIYEASAKSYATDEIKTEVIRINPSFQKSVCYFKLGWQKVYGRQLTFEGEEINKYYENTITQVIQRDRLDFERNTLENQSLRQTLFQTLPNQDDLLTNYTAYPEIYKYDREWQDELDTLQKRKSTLSEYINVLDKIAIAHASLEKASGGKGQGQETYCQQSASVRVKLQDINAFVDEIGKDIKAIKALEVKDN
jgi:hypothetical protein